jgi:D-alanyl-D-alanine carboxypeptidase
VHSCRRRFWRRLVAVALAAGIACSPLTHAYASGGRHAVLVVDANTGRVLYQRAADEPRFPASLAKLMTLYLLFEQLAEGRLSLTDKIRFSANAVAQPPSSLDVEVGAEIAVIDAIKALIVKSANDVAVAVAEHIAGSQEKFAELMSRKARDLGMTATVFRNASGLPDAEQVTTARDMITLALRLHDQFPKHYSLFATRTFRWGGETYRNHNTLLFRYAGLEGMKTGYIRASGFNLVASARRGNKHVLAAYFGGKTAALRNAAVRAHLDTGFDKASQKKTRHPGPLLMAQAKAPPDTPPVDARQAVAEAVAPAPAGPAQIARPEPNAPPIAFAAVPEPQPASRPPVAAATGLELMRARPVLAEGAMPAAEAASRAPADIEDLLNQPEAAPPAEAPRSTASEDAAPAARTAAVAAAASAPLDAFQVQVGAYQTQDEAERQLASVRQRAGSVLDARTSHLAQLKRGEIVIFRARYTGFDGRSSADHTCTELKRLKIDCLVMKAE